MTRFDASKLSDQKVAAVLPQRRDLFYGGSWQAPQGGYVDTLNPGTGESLGPVAEADATDVDAAVRAAHQGFRSWRNVAPLDRGRMLRQIAAGGFEDVRRQPLSGGITQLITATRSSP